MTPLLKKVLIRFPAGAVIILAMLFIPAGTLNFRPAWIFSGVILVPMMLVLAYFLKKDPALLERRMRTHEKEAPQKLIVRLSLPFFLIMFLLPGFDHRFHWSAVPEALMLASNGMVLLGYLIVIWVFKENTYTSRVVEVEKGQKLITTGPYALVRHPMYFGFLLMYLFVPLALGSFWALIPYPMILLVMILRLKNEETVLRAQLPGYAEYCARTRYRLLPRIW